MVKVLLKIVDALDKQVMEELKRIIYKCTKRTGWWNSSGVSLEME
jgi:hypothetical protein